MINGDDDSIQNISGLKLLESLDLGQPRKIRKEETKNDNFEDEMNLLLSKLNNQMNTVKNKNNFNFELKPFVIDMDFGNSINLKQETSNNDFNNKNNESQILKNGNNNNINNNNNNNNINNNNNRGYILQSSLNERINNLSNNNNNGFNNFITPTQKGDIESISQNNNNNINNNELNNNTPQNINNSVKKVESNNNTPNNNNKEDDFDLDIDEIPEFDNINEENNNNNNINNKKMEKNNLLDTNINPNGNYKIDPNEIDVKESDLEDNNDLRESLKEEEEKKKIEEEKRIQKEKEEEEIRKKEEERKKMENDEREEIEEKNNLEEKEEIEEKNNLEEKEEIKESNKIEQKEEIKESNKIEEKEEITKERDEISINNENKLENNSEKENLKNKNNNVDQNKIKEKEEKKQDEGIINIEDIDSVMTEKNLGAPESANVSGIIPSMRNTKKSELKSKNIKNGDSIDEMVQDKQKEKNSKNNDSKEEEKNTKFKPELRTKTMPENNNKKLKNSAIKKEIKKSYTQKSNIQQIRAHIRKKVVEKDEESMPDLSNIEDYPILINFSKEEKALSEIIPDYKEKILDKENKEEIEARQYFLYKTKSFQDDIKEGEKFSQLIGELETSHPELMKKLYEEQKLNNLPEFDPNVEKKIFEEDKINEMNCPIGGVEDFDSFSLKYFLNNNPKIIESSKKFFSKWRRILGDGNSFYRILMFSFFEAYILSNNTEELQYLLNEMTSDEFIEIYKEKEVDYKTCFSIFSLLLNYIENNNSEKAYEIFIKAYLLKDHSFDKLLITYIRHIITKYIDTFKKLLNNENQNFDDNNKLNTYLIESPYIEPSFIIICIIPYLFNVNMNILTLKGELLKPVQSQINFVDPEENTIPLITFGFFFSSYYKLYSSDFEKKYNYNLNLIENNNKQLTYMFKNLKKCDNCGKETEQILFIEKKFKICKICLEDHLSYACNFRADAFKEDGFIGLEYYTRPILICDNYYIDDLEIIELLESLNILNALCQKYRFCNLCKKNKDNGELINFKCGCLFCQDCLEQTVFKLTNGLKYLNPIEKKEIESTKCNCGKIFDIDEALKHVKCNKNDIKESSNRLRQYINTLCLTCNRELRAEDNLDHSKYIDINDQIKYRKIKIKKNNKNERANNVEYMEIDHLICEQCYMKYFQSKSGKIEFEEDDNNEDEHSNNDNIVDYENRTINCGICCRKHDLDPKLFNEGGCCTGCSII